MDFLEKVKKNTNKMFKSFELSIEELVKMEPAKIEDVIEDFEQEIVRLKNRIDELDEEKAQVKAKIEEHKQKRKELIKKLKKKI